MTDTEKFSRYKELGPLHDLLLKSCPPGHSDTQSIPILAESLGVSHQYVYKWITKNKVPPKFVAQMVELSQGRVTLEDFHPYIF